MVPEHTQQIQASSTGRDRTCAWIDWFGPMAFWPLLAISIILLLQHLAGAPFRVAFELDPASFSVSEHNVVSASLPRSLAPNPGQLDVSVVTENGHGLPYPVRSRSLIEKHGLGRYLFRGGMVYFSSTDHDNPAKNGRSYEALVPRKIPRWWVALSGVATTVLGVFLFLRGDGFGIPPWKRASLDLPLTAEPSDRRGSLLAFRISAAVLAVVVMWAVLLLMPASGIPLFASLPFVNEWTWKVGAIASFLVLFWAAAAPFSTRRDAALRITDVAFQTLAVLVLVVLRLPGCFLLQCNPDESDWIVGANVLAADPRYWISFDGVTSGPLVLFPLLLIKLAGLQVTYLTVKLFVIGLWSLIVLLFFRSVAVLFGGRIARLMLLPVVFAVATMSQRDFIGYNGEHIPILLLALAIYLHARLTTAAGGGWSAFFLGVALGSVPYAKLQAAPMALLIAVFTGIPWLVRRDRRLVLLIAGGIAPSVFLLVYLASLGALDEFLRSYLAYNIEYARQYAGGTGFLQGLGQTIDLITSASAGLGYFFLTWFVACGLGLGWMRIARRDIPADRFVLAGLALCLSVVSFYCVHQPQRPFQHYLLFLLLPAAFLMAVLVGLAISCGRRTLAVAVIAICITAGLPLLLCLFRDRHEVLVLPAPLAVPIGIGSSPLAEEIRRHAGPGERMAIWGWASRYYIQSGLLPATRVAVNSRQVNESSYREYYIGQYVRDLETNRPKIFLELDPNHPLGMYREIADYVAAHFHPVADIDGAIIHLRNDP